jgi:hypothetical protein
LLASGVLTPRGPKHLLALHAARTPVLFAKPADVLTTSRPAGSVDPRDRLIKLAGLPPLHCEVRAAKFFHVSCEACARFAFKKDTPFTDEEERAKA